ncbi:hypothetical protein AWRI1631_20200 [Saccharomyces cerevisiae AWRI1631]|uniref:Uncharacterized protein n=1 Tax=Saccharomyces cerevisiae (strain AWRI1631) TaxID=545124 RepID=B5VDQ4_YEAS6|nr:hypothetical protein AWRI1631_20200 [Saccharomyces cerevisiae AWRI1631]
MYFFLLKHITNSFQNLQEWQRRKQIFICKTPENTQIPKS